MNTLLDDALDLTGLIECNPFHSRERNPDGEVVLRVAKSYIEITTELATARESLRVAREAIDLYAKWADRTGDYPHDEEGCGAHHAILESRDALAALDWIVSG